MGDNDEPLSGDVEIDETTWGGKPRKRHGASPHLAEGKPRWESAKPKPTILGMVERGGRVRFRVISTRHGAPLSRAVTANVNPDSIIFTDDWASYKPLKDRYIVHKVINHSEGIYVRGDTYTNTIEGAFGNMKTGMRGVYKHVSSRYLQSYLDEYAWRHNAKPEGSALFGQLLDRAAAGKRPEV
jgi:transposase